MFKKCILTVLTISISASSFAGGMTGWRNIESVYVRETVTDIKVSSSVAVEGTVCTVGHSIRIRNDKNFSNTQAMISTALAAFMAGKSINAYIGECDGGGYPVVYAIQVQN